MKKAFAILLILFFWAATGIADEKVIVAAADPWPPFVDPSHPQEGISLELIRAAYKTQGFTVKMEYVPWARAEKGVKDAKKYDILPDTWKTEKRLEYLEYSDPYAANEIAFIKRKDDPFEFNGLASLKGKKVGIVRGYGYKAEFMNDPNFTRDESNNLSVCVKKLLKKRIDLTLEDRIVARVTVAKEDANMLNDIAFTENALSSNDLFVTVGKKNPRSRIIIEAFNKGLAEIKANGQYKKIMESYGGKQ